jgi:hypothetical protein
MRHSGWFPDHVLRLFRREKGRFTGDLVHERVICNGRVARLAAVLDHHPVARLEDAIARLDSYSTAGARMLASRPPVSFWSGIAHGCGRSCGPTWRLDFDGARVSCSPWQCGRNLAVT